MTTNEMQREFDEAMRETYRVAHQHGYRASRFLQLIESHGVGLPAAKYLLEIFRSFGGVPCLVNT